MKRLALQRGEGSFRAFTLFLVLAFTLQSFVTQTHIHISGHLGKEPGIAKLLKTPAQNPLSPDSGNSSCAFCQAIAHSGAFFAPVAPQVVLQDCWAVVANLPTALGTIGSSFTHNWQSRAPPEA